MFENSFMKPEYHIGRAWHIDTTEGTKFFFAYTPFDENGIETETDEQAIAWFADLLGEQEIYSINRDDYPKVYCRLSASGYMDCTDWSGPFDTLESAKKYLEDTYGDDEESE